MKELSEKFRSVIENVLIRYPLVNASNMYSISFDALFYEGDILRVLITVWHFWQIYLENLFNLDPKFSLHPSVLFDQYSYSCEENTESRRHYLTSDKCAYVLQILHIFLN